MDLSRWASPSDPHAYIFVRPRKMWAKVFLAQCRASLSNQLSDEPPEALNLPPTTGNEEASSSGTDSDDAKVVSVANKVNMVSRQPPKRRPPQRRRATKASRKRKR